MAVGRANWKFADTPAGASADIYSLVVNAKINDLDPYGYVVNVARALLAAAVEPHALGDRRRLGERGGGRDDGL